MNHWSGNILIILPFSLLLLVGLILPTSSSLHAMGMQMTHEMSEEDCSGGHCLPTDATSCFEHCFDKSQTQSQTLALTFHSPNFYPPVIFTSFSWVNAPEVFPPIFATGPPPTGSAHLSTQKRE